MDPSGVTVVVAQHPQCPQQDRNRQLPKAVEKAWNARFASQREEDRKKFESLACKSLEEYVKKLEDACTEHRKENKMFQAFDWFEPLFQTVQIFTSVANVALAAHPNPGAFILGGIVAAMQTTSRLLQYQKLTVRMLMRMSIKAKTLAAYEYDLYKEEEDIQRGIINVAGDILQFCLKAVDFVSENGQIRAKVKHLALMIVSDYDAQLGKEVESFQLHVEELEASAALCDKKRLQNIFDSQAAHRKETEQFMAQIQDQHRETRVGLLKAQHSLDGQEQLRREKRKERLLDWLSPLTFRNSYEQRRRSHLAGTGSWFLDLDSYKDWKLSSHSDLLWIKGKPGCGKSFLAALAIMDIELDLDPDKAMAYVICQRDNQASQTLYSLLGALAKQLAEGVPDIDAMLDAQYVASRRETFAGPSTVDAALDAAISRFSEVCIIIDALDECKEYIELAEELLRLMTDAKGPNLVKVIVFSRPDSTLETLLTGHTQINPIEFNRSDIESYIHSRFPDDKNQVTRTIREECSKKADGMFLWVKLLADMLVRRPLTEKQKLKRVNAIPPQLGSMYDAVLQDIWNQDEDTRDVAFRVLLWTTNAYRPLGRREMIYAVADFSDARSVDELDLYPTPEDLVTLCGNLIYIDPQLNIRLIHESVRSYLETDEPTTAPLRFYQRQASDAGTLLTTVCLRYMMLDDFASGPTRTKKQLSAIVRSRAFIFYAVRYWPWHLPVVLEESLRHLIARFMQSRSHRDLAMQIAVYDGSARIWDPTRTSNELQFLAFYGLRSLVEHVSDAGEFLRGPNGYNVAPIESALNGRHQSMVLWILELSQTLQDLEIPYHTKAQAVCRSAELGWADVLDLLLSDDRRLITEKLFAKNCSALSRACISGHAEVVDILIKHRADLSSADDDGLTALMYGAYHGHLDVVQRLLQNGADIQCQDHLGTNVLHYAALGNQPGVIKALLQSGDSSFRLARDGDGQTALHIAARNNAPRAIEILLQDNASDLNLPSTHGWTAIRTATEKECTEAIQELLKFGVDVDIPDLEGRTPLFVAAYKGHLTIVCMLLAAKCNVLAKAKSGETALHMAAYSGKLRVLIKLKEATSTQDWQFLVQQPGKNGHTPLHIAVHDGKEKNVSLLLDGEPNKDRRNDIGWHMLHLAAYAGHKHLCRMLLQHTSDANPRNSNGDTPVHIGAREGRLEFLRDFFKECSGRGLEIEHDALNYLGHSALRAALARGHESVANFLIERGRVPNIRDQNGDLPIHIAAQYGLESVVRALLAYGGGNTKGFGERTPLFFAAAQAHLPAVDTLVSAYPETLNIPDENGDTPLSILLRRGHVDLAHHLLDLGADPRFDTRERHTMLHFAAHYGDTRLVQRLISLGCEPDALDASNKSPLRYAVYSGHADVAKLLIDHAPHTLDLPDDFGYTLTILAASTGIIELLEMVSVHNPCYTVQNNIGRNAAYVAAARGHREVLEYLAAKKAPLHLSDVRGITPLMIAAENGFLESVQYLAQAEPDHINDCDNIAHTALAKAVMHNKTQAARALILAGAKITSRFPFGHPDLDSTSTGLLTLRTSRSNKGKFHTQQSLREYIRRCSEGILALEEQLTEAGLAQRARYIQHLAQALNLVGDGPLAEYCFMELYLHLVHGKGREYYFCDLCGTEDFDGTVFVCKTCYGAPEICHKCFDEHSSDEGVVWEAYKTVIELEKQIQPLRLVTSRHTSLAIVGAAVNEHQTGKRWVESQLEKYESWEHRFASNRRFAELSMPGKWFLKIMKEWSDLKEKEGVDNNLKQERDTLDSRYKTHRRKNRADDEITHLPCEKHEFLMVSKERHDRAKSEGNYFDGTSERLTQHFFQEILTKYSDSEASTDSTAGAETQGSGTSSTGSASASTNLDLTSEVCVETKPCLESTAEQREAKTSGQGIINGEERYPTSQESDEDDTSEDEDGEEEDESAFRRRVEAAYWLQNERRESEEDKVIWFLAVDVLRAMSKDLAEQYLTYLEEKEGEDDE